MPEIPTLETPPKPPVTPPDRLDSGASLTRVRTTKFGELDHSDLVHLLESLDDDREKARFRESIYISLFIWIAIAWFAIYGPRFLFHQGKVITPIGDRDQRDKNELTELDLPRSLVHAPRAARVPSPAPAPAPAVKAPQPPEPPAARRPTPPPQPPAQPAPQPARSAPQPAQPAPQPAQPPPPPAPTPQPYARQPIPDAPHPTAQQPAQPRPSFSVPGTAGESIASATRDASRPGLGDNGDLGSAPRSRRGGPIAGTGYQLMSDPQGVDFDPYIKRILAMIRAGWLPLIPEEVNPPISKAGMTLIRFRIEKDGTITPGAMRLEDSTHDEAIDRAAWGGITSVGKFPPLPKEYPGTNIDLRIQFNIIQQHGR